MRKDSRITQAVKSSTLALRPGGVGQSRHKGVGRGDEQQSDVKFQIDLINGLMSDDRAEWSTARRSMAHIVESKWFDTAMALVIVVNVVVIVQETDYAAACSDNAETSTCDFPAHINMINTVLLLIYCTEASFKLWLYKKEYFHSGWNSFDFAIVVVSVASELLGGLFPSVSSFRIARVARVTKFMKCLLCFPALYMIVKGFLSAMVSIFWASSLLFFILGLWSIISVMVLHPIITDISRDSDLYAGCERCTRAFQTVGQGFLTLLQTIIFGDSWGLVAIPIIERAPWTILIFGGVFATVILGFFSLILAVIVESAAAAREDDCEFQIMMKEQMKEKFTQNVQFMCESIDSDQTGTLSLDEIMAAYETREDFRKTCQSVGINITDLRSLLAVADVDDSGAVDYHELIDLMLELKTADLRHLLTFLKLSLSEIRMTQAKQFSKLSGEPPEPSRFKTILRGTRATEMGTQQRGTQVNNAPTSPKKVSRDSDITTTVSAASHDHFSIGQAAAVSNVSPSDPVETTSTVDRGMGVVPSHNAFASSKPVVPIQSDVQMVSQVTPALNASAECGNLAFDVSIHPYVDQELAALTLGDHSDQGDAPQSPNGAPPLLQAKTQDKVLVKPIPPCADDGSCDLPSMIAE